MGNRKRMPINKYTLKTGMIIKFRSDGSLYMVIVGEHIGTTNENESNIIFINNDGYMTGWEHLENLTHYDDDNWDIVSVWKGKIYGMKHMFEQLSDKELIWSE